MSEGIKFLRLLRLANFWESNRIDLIVNVRSEATSRHASSDKFEIPIDSPISLIDSFVVTKRLLECAEACAEEAVFVDEDDALLLIADEEPFTDWPFIFDPVESFIIANRIYGY